MGVLHKKTKGEIAELIVAATIIENGWNVAVPFGENTRYDLVAEKENQFLRIQVKYVTPKSGALEVNCKSSNNWSILHYTPDEIDILAVYDATNEKAYFIPADEINKSSLKLRLERPKNNQKKHIRYAVDYLEIPLPNQLN